MQGPEEWMTIPQGVSNCPPGLEYLSMIDQIFVYQKIDMLELITGHESDNKYSIKNSRGQKVYSALEHNTSCMRRFCGTRRSFNMMIYDNSSNEVIHLYRPLRCDCCCCPCCLQSLRVSAPPGTVVGFIKQKWSICKPHYDLENAAGDVVLRIKGPICTMTICRRDVEFHVYSSDGASKVGRIAKQWSGTARERYTSADNFGISFPMDLDVRMKAVLLGACFLIDFMFFEESPDAR